MIGCVMRSSHTAAQFGDPLPHLGDCRLHIAAAIVLGGDVRIQIHNFLSKVSESLLTLAVGQLGSDAVFGGPQFLDMPHRVVDGADLALHLGEQVKLVRGEDFGLLFEGPYFASAVRLVAHGCRTSPRKQDTA
jgi:hypothetical protein